MFGHQIKNLCMQFFPEKQAAVFECIVSVLPAKYDITCGDRIIFWKWVWVLDEKTFLQIARINLFDST